jgi:copper homeostasis protein (lipoprotein)
MKGLTIGLALILVCFISMGCIGAHSKVNNHQKESALPRGAERLAGGVFPATYTGVLPCADCPGIHYTLNLWPDRAYFLRMTYLGKGQGDGESFDDIGVWTLSPDEKTLTLRGGREAPVMFSIKTRDVLRKLDLKGKEIASKLNYDLVRREHLEWFEPRLSLRGMYMVMADAGLFQECLTGRKLPVGQEGENAKLESSYLKARRQPGEQLLVAVEGRIVLRPKMEGRGEQEMLVVEHFVSVWPGETCGKSFSTPELEETYWKLVQLGKDAVLVAPNRKEIHLRLDRQSRRAQGFAGCNRFIGGYELVGQSLRFLQLATTRMACPEGMDQEQAFLKALESTTRWNIFGGHLELYGQGGEPLARFEARYMK